MQEFSNSSNQLKHLSTIYISLVYIIFPVGIFNHARASNFLNSSLSPTPTQIYQRGRESLEDEARTGEGRRLPEGLESTHPTPTYASFFFVHQSARRLLFHLLFCDGVSVGRRSRHRRAPSGAAFASYSASSAAFAPWWSKNTRWRRS